MPQIYSGDEIVMPGGGDPDNRRDFPGGFAAADSAANAAKANAFAAAGRSAAEQAMFSWVSELAALRKAHPALACGAEQVLSSDKDLLVYARYGRAGCPDEPAAGTAETVVVVMQRGAAAPVQMKLEGTVLAEGCKAGPALAGAGQVSEQGGQLTIVPKTPFLVFACQ